MAEEKQSIPIYKGHQKSTEQETEKLRIYNSPSKQTSNKLFIYAFSAFVLVAVAALIFSLIVLRVNSPTINLSSISLLNSSSNSIQYLTFFSQISLYNPNFGSFNFDNATVGFLHGGAVVGESTTPAGRAAAKGTKMMNVTVEANLGQNVTFPNFTHLGVLNLISFANFRGTVRLIHLLKKTVSSAVTCSVNIDFNTTQVRPDWLCE